MRQHAMTQQLHAHSQTIIQSDRLSSPCPELLAPVCKEMPNLHAQKEGCKKTLQTALLFSSCLQDTSIGSTTASNNAPLPAQTDRPTNPCLFFQAEMPTQSAVMNFQSKDN